MRVLLTHLFVGVQRSALSAQHRPHAWEDSHTYARGSPVTGRLHNQISFPFLPPVLGPIGITLFHPSASHPVGKLSLVRITTNVVILILLSSPIPTIITTPVESTGKASHFGRWSLNIVRHVPPVEGQHKRVTRGETKQLEASWIGPLRFHPQISAPQTSAG